MEDAWLATSIAAMREEALEFAAHSRPSRSQKRPARSRRGKRLRPAHGNSADPLPAASPVDVAHFQTIAAAHRSCRMQEARTWRHVHRVVAGAVFTPMTQV